MGGIFLLLGFTRCITLILTWYSMYSMLLEEKAHSRCARVMPRAIDRRCGSYPRQAISRQRCRVGYTRMVDYKPYKQVFYRHATSEIQIYCRGNERIGRIVGGAQIGNGNLQKYQYKIPGSIDPIAFIPRRIVNDEARSPWLLELHGSHHLILKSYILSTSKLLPNIQMRRYRKLYIFFLL